MTYPKPKRRFLQFSLRSFFILMTVFAIWFGWVMNEAREQKKAVEWVEEMGGEVGYEFEVDEYGNFGAYFVKPTEPHGPKWIRDILGADFFDDVVLVNLNGSQVSDLAPLGALRHLHHLHIRGTPTDDLTPVATLVELQTLDASSTQVTDLSPIGHLTSLEYLDLSCTNVSDLAPVRELRNLKELRIIETQVQDLTPVGQLINLESLHFGCTNVSDLSTLSKLQQLQVVDLSYTKVIDVSPVANLKQIQVLYVCNTFSEEKVAQLSQTFPSIQFDLTDWYKK